RTLQRHVPRRMLERKLVRQLVRRAAHHRIVARRLRMRATAQQAPGSHTTRVCAGADRRYTFSFSNHRTDIIPGTELGVTSVTVDSLALPYESHGRPDTVTAPRTSSSWSGVFVQSSIISATVYVIDSPGHRRPVPTKADIVMVTNRAW